MAEIAYDEETTRDWSWYAVDEVGNVAVFATGTFRNLPAGVRSDWERAEGLIKYFDAAPETRGFRVRQEFGSSDIVANDSAILKDEKRRARYFRSFGAAAARGLFAYDTVLKVQGDYYGVTIPECPLHLSMLPNDLQKKLASTRARLSFRDAPRISEDVTLRW